MSVTFAIAIYVVIWWTVLFAVLPIGVRTQGEDGAVVPGTPESAPTRAAPAARRAADDGDLGAGVRARSGRVGRYGIVDLERAARPRAVAMPRALTPETKRARPSCLALNASIVSATSLRATPNRVSRLPSPDLGFEPLRNARSL